MKTLAAQVPLWRQGGEVGVQGLLTALLPSEQHSPFETVRDTNHCMRQLPAQILGWTEQPRKQDAPHSDAMRNH